MCGGRIFSIETTLPIWLLCHAAMQEQIACVVLGTAGDVFWEVGVFCFIPLLLDDPALPRTDSCQKSRSSGYLGHVGSCPSEVSVLQLCDVGLSL